MALVLVAACGGEAAVPDPSVPPAEDPLAPLDVPTGPVLFKPDELILPANEFPLAGFKVGRDQPLTALAWERQFVSPDSPDFHWFTVRIYVLEPDVPSAKFIKENGCETVKWPAEPPAVREVDASPSGEPARACRYEFVDGQRVLYHTTGYRNVGIVVGLQPRRERISDRLALDWLAALARRQTAVIGRFLMDKPPPKVSLP